MLSIGASKYADRTVTIHCPDVIRETFESQGRDGYLDRMFALSLYSTMKRCGAFRMYKPDSEYAWLDGFEWMKR